jgi:hypothetical protein
MAELLNRTFGAVFENVEDERLYRKQRLAAGFRLFGRFGFDEGVAERPPGDCPAFNRQGSKCECSQD